MKINTAITKNKVFGGLLAVAALLGGVLVATPHVEAQSDYASSIPGYCVSSFYDREMYGWLAYQNNCGQAINLTWVGIYSGGASSATIYPGRKANTGFSQAEVNGKGGFELFVCPAGYIPVDGNDNFVERANTLFRCKRE
jgi:hypothetical protein